jgi:SAM-dependent methyltransferase
MIGRGCATAPRRTGICDPLRDPARLALLEIDRVIGHALCGATVRSVLDVGTGSGVFAEAFARRDLRVAGIDPDPLRLATARCAMPEGRFALARAEELPFPDGAFDLAFFGVALHEIGQPVRALAQARRVAPRRVAVLEWPGPGFRFRGEDFSAIAARAGFGTSRAIALAHLVLYLLTTTED